MGNKGSKQSEKPPQRPLGDINVPEKSVFARGTNPAWRQQLRPVETVKYANNFEIQYHRPPKPKPPPPVTLPPVSQEKPALPWKADLANIWRNYIHKNVAKENWDEYDNRLVNNADKVWQEEERIRSLRRQTDRAESALFTEKPSPTPPLTLQSSLNFSSRYSLLKQHDEKFFTKKPERPPLTPEMYEIIKNASKPQDATQVLSKIDGVDLARKDFRTLTGLNWLNDEIINAYMFLIVQRSREANRKKVYAFNTFFWPKVKGAGYSSVKRWTKKVDIFSFDFLLVPVHLGNHWCLAFIDFTRRRIEYYDSLGGGSEVCCDTLLEYLRYESNDKKKQDFDDENWQLINMYHECGIPEQKNGSDCGVFACIFAEYLTRQAKLTFTQEHMQYFREKMIYELITQRILE